MLVLWESESLYHGLLLEVMISFPDSQGGGWILPLALQDVFLKFYLNLNHYERYLPTTFASYITLMRVLMQRTLVT